MTKENIRTEKEERVAIFIDGSNLFYKLRDLGIPNLSYFGYGDLASWLSDGRRLVSKKYYVGVVRAREGDEKAQALRKRQIRLFNHLGSKVCGFVVERGYIMHNDGRFYEKGVDVKIAVDLLVGAYEDEYDTAILISSDTDLVPAIEKVRLFGKRIEYVGFAHKPSLGLIRNADSSKLLSDSDVRVFQNITER